MASAVSDREYFRGAEIAAVFPENPAISVQDALDQHHKFDQSANVSTLLGIPVRTMLLFGMGTHSSHGSQLKSYSFQIFR